MTERLDKWMDGYVLAWSTNDAGHIGALFADDAVYDPQTGAGERNGIGEIVAWWTEIDDDEENWDFQWQPLVDTDELAVVTGQTRYFAPAMSYRNLFVIRFVDDGRCYDFTEWYIEED
jgi:hypothetical protein